MQAATEQEEEEELVDDLESLDGDFVSDEDSDDRNKNKNAEEDVNASSKEEDADMNDDFDGKGSRNESKQKERKQELTEDEIPPKAGIAIDASVAVIECILSLERELRVCISDTARAVSRSSPPKRRWYPCARFRPPISPCNEKRWLKN